MDNSHLYILWTNADLLTAEKMVFMYSMNSLKKGWWQKVTMIIWGATTRLVVENEVIQEKIREAAKLGMELIACKSCADQLGHTQQLEHLGIEVKYTGELLTQLLKEEEHLLTI